MIINLPDRQSGQTIAFDDLMKLGERFGIDEWEWDRTHWTMKEIDLEMLEPYLKGKDVSKPEIFVSYSWTPPEHKQKVEALIDRLEKDGINVRYDENVLLPGQNINYVMERELTSNETDAVIVVWNKEYVDKVDNKSGGVGFESDLILNEIRDNPLQSKYIPVILEHDEKGKPPLPRSMKSRYYLDLSMEGGYEKLLGAIRRQSQNPTKSKI